MYIIGILISSAFIVSCHTQKSLEVSTVHTEGIDPRGNLMLLGKSTRQRLQQAPFGSWFNTNYADYRIDSATAHPLKSIMPKFRFVIFMGTWCGDSRQEVPKIYKILDYCEVPAAHIQLVNVDIYDSVYKQSPTHEEKGLNIHRVPDLLVYENGREIGRIVEKPVRSWERDLGTIVRREKYESHYRVVTYLHRQFQTFPDTKIANNIVKNC